MPKYVRHWHFFHNFYFHRANWDYFFYVNNLTLKNNYKTVLGHKNNIWGSQNGTAVFCLEIIPAFYGKLCHLSLEKTLRGIRKYMQQLFKWVQAIIILGMLASKRKYTKIRKFNSAGRANTLWSSWFYLAVFYFNVFLMINKAHKEFLQVKETPEKSVCI